MSSSEHVTNQTHDGDGDNVAGNKYVHNAVNAKAFYEPIEEVLNLSRKRKFDESIKKLEALEAASSLDNDAKSLLKVCRIYLSLQKNFQNTDIDATRLAKLSNSTDELIRDLAISSQIRLDIGQSRNDDASKRYQMLDESFLHSKEVFFELAASENDIRDYFKSNKLSLTEQELCGLMRGATRIKAFTLTEEIGARLTITFPDINSEILIAFANLASINEELIGKHYWAINAKVRDQLIEHCKTFGDLLERTQGEDSRVVEQASTLAHYTLGEYEPLLTSLWKYNAEVRKVAPETSVALSYQFQKISPEDNEPSSKLSRALIDPGYKDELIKELIEQNVLTPSDSQLLVKLGDSSSISRWIEAGGQVSSEIELEKDILDIELKVRAVYGVDDKKGSFKIAKDIDSFLTKHGNEVKSLNPVNILELMERLNNIDLPDSSAKLAKFFIPDSDMWLSPITNCYLRALLYSEQHMTLASVLSEINSDTWDSSTWQIKAQQLAGQHKYVEAVKAASESTKLNPLSSQSWCQLLACKIASKAEGSTIIDIIKSIPNNLFEEPSENGYWLLFIAAKYDCFDLTERVALKWFIDSPEDNAVAFTNLNFTFAVEGIEKKLHYTDKVDDCMALSYEVENKPYLKLLCETTKPSNYTLDINSDRGMALITMEEGQETIDGINEVKLLKKIPPYQAAISIAKDIRLDINDGSDCFYAFEVPSKPDQMLATITKKISLANKGMEALKSLDIPVYLKGARYSKFEPVKAALTLFTDSMGIIKPLPGFGENKPLKIIIDVYGACYLALAGTVNALLRSDIELIMTVETKLLIQSWIDDVNREDYLTIGFNSEGSLRLDTYEDMKVKTSTLQENLRLLTTHALSPDINLVDYPSEISKIADSVDPSVMSSLKLSIANDIPWFCIDLTFAQLSQSGSYKIVNCAQFLPTLLANTPLSSKIDGLYIHLHCQLPYILCFNELAELADSNRKESNQLLLDLLKKNQVSGMTIEMAAQFLSSVFMIALLGAVNDEREKIEELFYQCCNNTRLCDMSKDAEFKVALMLHNSFRVAHNVPGLVRIIQNLAARYISGHFLSFRRINEHLYAMSQNMDLKGKDDGNDYPNQP
jgi:hypothetical protein